MRLGILTVEAVGGRKQMGLFAEALEILPVVLAVRWVEIWVGTMQSDRAFPPHPSRAEAVEVPVKPQYLAEALHFDSWWACRPAKIVPRHLGWFACLGMQ
jgi:hypothetical protein